MVDVCKTIGDCYQVVAGSRMHTAPVVTCVVTIPSKMRSGEQKYLEVYFCSPLFLHEKMMRRYGK